ncbi:MAG TPA: PilT/PilU family type 4a pilus ATPase [Gemmatimonadaceae bacterium]|nr:PilT/PilU family type 4a pilus ATPase [Gemmatimonadaceae bacterium]
MAQIDKLLARLGDRETSVLRLTEDDAARLESGGSVQPLTRQPLTAAQLTVLLREIATDEVRAQLDSHAATFTYANGRKAYEVKVTPASESESGKLQAEIRSAADRESGVEAPGRDAADSSHDSAPASSTRHAARVEEPELPPSDPARRAEMEVLLKQLVERSASDLHLRVGEPPILRLHGEMQRIEGFSVMEDAVLAMLLNSIMPDRNKREFRDTNDTDFAHEIEGVARFRCNALRDRKGVAAVFRVIPANVVTVDDLGISEEVQRLSQLPRGLVLVTGPTGSGKSTTLCSLIDLVNRTRRDHVITIEDPIEFVHQNKGCLITQRQVGVHTGSFKHALRAALREDPDIILVGELRDLETVSIAIETAETGHLVFGTLHTTSAVSTVDRLIDQFPADRQSQIRVMLSESLKGVISQVLCKKVGGGRVAAREVLLSIPAVSNLIREGKTFQIPSIMQTSKRLGMLMLNDALITLVDSGEVAPAEAYQKASDKAGMVVMLKQRQHDTSFLDASEAGAAASPRPDGAGKGAKVGAR